MLTPRKTLVASGIIPLITLRVFIFIKTETKNAEKNSSTQINTWSIAAVKETMLALCLDIYFSLELCLDLTVGLQQLAFGRILSQASFFFFLCKKEEREKKKKDSIVLISQISFLSKKDFKKIERILLYFCVSLEDIVLSSQHDFPSGFLKRGFYFSFSPCML